MMRETGCDGVIVGRGCLGRPWLFGDLAAAFEGREPDPPPSFGRVVEIMTDHARRLMRFFGPEHGMRMMRKWAAWVHDRVPRLGARPWRARARAHARRAARDPEPLAARGRPSRRTPCAPSAARAAASSASRSPKATWTTSTTTRRPGRARAEGRTPPSSAPSAGAEPPRDAERAPRGGGRPAPPLDRSSTVFTSEADPTAAPDFGRLLPARSPGRGAFSPPPLHPEGRPDAQSYPPQDGGGESGGRFRPRRPRRRRERRRRGGRSAASSSGPASRARW